MCENISSAPGGRGYCGTFEGRFPFYDGSLLLPISFLSAFLAESTIGEEAERDEGGIPRSTPVYFPIARPLPISSMCDVSSLTFCCSCQRSSPVGFRVRSVW